MSLPFGILAVGMPALGLAIWNALREDTFGQELEAAIREEARISGGTLLPPPPESQSDHPAHDPWTAISTSEDDATKVIGPDQECMMCLQYPTGGHFISSCQPVPHVFCRECLLTWWSTPAEEAHGLKRHCTLCHTPWSWGFDRDETIWHSGLREHQGDPGKVVFGWISTRQFATADDPVQPISEIFRMLGAFNVVTGQVTMYKMDAQRGPGVDHPLPTIVVSFGEFLAALAGRITSVDTELEIWTRKLFTKWTFSQAIEYSTMAVRNALSTTDRNHPIFERNLILHFKDFAKIRFIKLFRPSDEGLGNAADYTQDPPFSIRLSELYVAIHEFLILTHWQRNVATVFTNRSGPAPAGRQVTTDASWLKARRNLETAHGNQVRLVAMRALDLLVQQVGDPLLFDILDIEKFVYTTEPYILGENKEWPEVVYED